MTARIWRRSFTALAMAATLPSCATPRGSAALRLGAPPRSRRAESGTRVLRVMSEQTSLSIDPDDAEQVESSLREIVASRVSGVSVERVGGVAKLHLGGRSAGSADGCALFVIDGVPLSDDFFVTIAAPSVERIDLMTDSVETAPYGPRGKRGVVLVALRGR
ncbi:MAG: rane protein [Gemmatimonadetes bacterium]|nr:rane protein [Gemmatimonadota bacterium]